MCSDVAGEEGVMWQQIGSKLYAVSKKCSFSAVSLSENIEREHEIN